MDSEAVLETPASSVTDPNQRKGRLILCGKVLPPATTLEYFLGGFVLALAVVVVGLAVTVAVLKSKSPLPNQNKDLDGVCLTRDCMWEAAYVLDNIDSHADPCEDFYAYSCGGYPQAHPRPSDSVDYTVFQMLSDGNQQKLRNILLSPIRNAEKINSAERKLKMFFQSCSDSFHLMSIAGRPLANFIANNKNLGGWVPLENFRSNVDTWTSLATVHTEFSAQPFFALTVEQDVITVMNLKPAENNVITINTFPNGAEFASAEYNKTYGDKVLAYRVFIANVIGQLRLDSNMTEPTYDQIHLWTDTILKIEKELAEIAEGAMGFPSATPVDQLPAPLKQVVESYYAPYAKGTVRMQHPGYINSTVAYIQNLATKFPELEENSITEMMHRIPRGMEIEVPNIK